MSIGISIDTGPLGGVKDIFTASNNFETTSSGLSILIAALDIDFSIPS